MQFVILQCSKAIEKACKSEEVINAIGEPIVRGPWYNASLAVAHKRQSVSCTFPVSGPQGTGIFQIKAVRNGGVLYSLPLLSFYSSVVIHVLSLHNYMV